MRKIVFIPVSVAGGVTAGMLGKKLFAHLWGLVDREEPPDAKHRDVDYRKLVAALALEGALFRVTRGLVDHGSRRGYARLTGTWPGDKAPDPE